MKNWFKIWRASRDLKKINALIADRSRDILANAANGDTEYNSSELAEMYRQRDQVTAWLKIELNIPLSDTEFRTKIENE